MVEFSHIHINSSLLALWTTLLSSLPVTLISFPYNVVMEDKYAGPLFWEESIWRMRRCGVEVCVCVWGAGLDWHSSVCFSVFAQTGDVFVGLSSELCGFKWDTAAFLSSSSQTGHVSGFLSFSPIIPPLGSVAFLTQCPVRRLLNRMMLLREREWVSSLFRALLCLRWLSLPGLFHVSWCFLPIPLPPSFVWW